MPTCSAAVSCWKDTPLQAVRQEGQPLSKARAALSSARSCSVQHPGRGAGMELLPHSTQAESQAALSGLIPSRPWGSGKGKDQRR